MKIGDRLVGDGQPCMLVGEIGINHNGEVDIAHQLIDLAAQYGWDAIKFQKRTIDVVYTADELARPRENPFGDTNGQLKHGLEFGKAEYDDIASYAGAKGIAWFASAWDEASVDFLEQYAPPAYKIASASLTDDNLLKHHRQYGRPIILSTGLSTLEQIDHAVEVLGTDNLVILHCTSTYPSDPAELNLKVIPVLAERYDVPIGYSGHESGLVTSAVAVAMGACMVERHITLDRAMWGSDQAASIEPPGMERLARYIEATAVSLGDGQKRVYDSELPIIEKLRRVE